MQSFHDNFKEEFNMLYELSDGSFNKRGWSLGVFLARANQFDQHLTMHHTIEETYLFPILGKRMKQFSETEGLHLESHKGIHDGPTDHHLSGLEQLAALVKNYKSEPSTYDPSKMRACLDSFREVLFSHLDQEVEDLRGDNLKKFFSLEEVESFPI
ncbi:hypothetical protein EV360DRAFT_92465 [Lentinula raphanica]|nr:hypothetical protein EV360DRAFT_92465 [Lentinula raphanica]